MTAVQLPLSSLSDDVAVVRRALSQHHEPTVLVGHSYGGVVISVASHGAQNVTGLVYVAAVATEEGEPAGAVLERFDPSEGLQAVVSDSEGYVSLDRDRFAAVFAGDVPATGAQVMAATQGPAAGACLSDPSGPGWHDRPSWYVLCSQDKTVRPEAQQWIADRLGATVVHADASHAVAVSQPSVVVDAVEQAIEASVGSRE